MYSSYWPLFSTFALIPINDVSVHSSSSSTLCCPLLLLLLLLLPQGARTLKYSHSGWVVIDPPCRSECRNDDRWGGHEIVCKGIVQVALQLKDILDLLKLLFVPAGKANVSFPSLDGVVGAV